MHLFVAIISSNIAVPSNLADTDYSNQHHSNSLLKVKNLMILQDQVDLFFHLVTMLCWETMDIPNHPLFATPVAPQPEDNLQKLLRNDPRNISKSSRRQPELQIPQIQSGIRESDGRNKIHGGHTSQPTRLKGSTASSCRLTSQDTTKGPIHGSDFFWLIPWILNHTETWGSDLWISYWHLTVFVTFLELFLRSFLLCVRERCPAGRGGTAIGQSCCTCTSS